jgi:hypothetical protein
MNFFFNIENVMDCDLDYYIFSYIRKRQPCIYI